MSLTRLQRNERDNFCMCKGRLRPLFFATCFGVSVRVCRGKVMPCSVLHVCVCRAACPLCLLLTHCFGWNNANNYPHCARSEKEWKSSPSAAHTHIHLSVKPRGKQRTITPQHGEYLHTPLILLRLMPFPIQRLGVLQWSQCVRRVAPEFRSLQLIHRPDSWIMNAPRSSNAVWKLQRLAASSVSRSGLN